MVSSSYPVAEHKALVGLAGSGIRGGGAVAVEHLARPPANETHERVVVAAGHAPLVGEGVPEGVRVQLRNAGIRAAFPDQLADAVVGHPRSSVDAEPEVGKLRLPLPFPLAEVAVERQGRSCGRTGTPAAGVPCP
jgi:hypothetical protein